MAASRRGRRGDRGCAAWVLWGAPWCPRGAGLGKRSPLPALADKASGSEGPAAARRSQSCGGERESAASSAASRPSPASQPACALGLAGWAGLTTEDVLRCCWVAASDSYV